MELGKIHHNEKIVEVLLFLCCLLFSILLLISFHLSLQFTLLDLSGDLRNRIVGTRLAIEGKDPYFYIWKPGAPERFVDYSANPNQIVSRLTVPPTVLLAHTPLASFTYHQIMLVWFAAEWLVYLLVLLFLLAKRKNVYEKAKIYILFCVFSPSLSWLSNPMVGQLYFFYLSMCIVAFYCINKIRGKGTAGLILGVLAALRPQYVVLLIPVLLLNVSAVKRIIFFIVVGFVLAVFVSVGVFGLGIWKNYLSAMSVQSSVTYIKDTLPSDIVSYYPKTIEGLQRRRVSLKGYWRIHDTSAKGVFINLFHREPHNLLLLFLGAVPLLLMLRLFWKRRGEASLQGATLPIGIVCVYVAEIFTPAPRYAYYDVLLLPLLISIVFSKLSLRVKIFFYALLTVFIVSQFWDTPVSAATLYVFLALYVLVLARKTEQFKNLY